ncbi:MAG TPA: hypothetical protein DIC23_05575, partial [Planctomycetaceae bacterium]|nr:hypothetical protein [Planctomycetaceae bacterium]
RLIEVWPTAAWFEMLTRSDRLHRTAIVENATKTPASWLNSIHRPVVQNCCRTAIGVSRPELEFL